MLKRILVALLFLAVTACGGQQEKSVGLREEVTLLIKNESLIGVSVAVDGAVVLRIAKEDLYTGVTDVLGAKDREDEKLEKVAIQLSPGTHDVSVYDASSQLYQGEMYFSAGQTREIRIRR